MQLALLFLLNSVVIICMKNEISHYLAPHFSDFP